MNIDRHMKMAKLIRLDPELLPLLYRLDIPLGFGEDDIESVCRKQNLNINFFLAITASFMDSELPVEMFEKVPVGTLINYIKENHNYYLETALPELDRLFKKLISDCRQNREKIEMVGKFLEEYQIELKNHIEKEEISIIPYVLKIESSINEGNIAGELAAEIHSKPINKFLEEADDVEEKIFELSNIIIKYLPVIQNQATGFAILTELFRFEKDIKIHAEIEDGVIVPKISRMEKQLMEIYRSRNK